MANNSQSLASLDTSNVKKVGRQFSKFVAVGLLNTGLDFLVLNLEMMMTGITSGPAMFILNSVSFSVATMNSYFFNKYWTFQDKEKAQEGSKFSLFLTVSIIGVVINGSIVYAVTTFVPPMFGLSETLWANFAKAAATGVSLFCNFIGYKFIVFKK